MGQPPRAGGADMPSYLVMLAPCSARPRPRARGPARRGADRAWRRQPLAGANAPGLSRTHLRLQRAADAPHPPAPRAYSPPVDVGRAVGVRKRFIYGITCAASASKVGPGALSHRFVTRVALSRCPHPRHPRSCGHCPPRWCCHVHPRPRCSRSRRQRPPQGA